MRALGIDMQTVFGMLPTDQANLAADLGCSHISTGVQPVPWQAEFFPPWSLRDDPGLRRDLAEVLRDRGVAIALGEGFTVRPGVEARDRAGDLDLFAGLGAERVGAVSMEPDRGRALDQLAQLAEMAGERGMGFVLEFAPPHPIGDLPAALAAVERIGNPACQVTIDAMHFFRSGATPAQLAAVPPERIGYVQLCDAPLVAPDDDYMREATLERRSPGEGELPLAELLAVVPTSVPIGLEIPIRSLAVGEQALRDSIARMVAAARRLLARAA